MKIRPAEPIDIEPILSLSQQGFDYDEQFDSTLNMSWSQSKEAHKYFSEHINSEDRLLLVASSEGKTIGYLAGSCRVAELYRRPMRIAELEVMYVAEEFRNKGAGHALVNEFYNWAKARDCNRARVIASAGNVRAAKFYRDNGFEDYTVTLEREI